MSQSIAESTVGNRSAGGRFQSRVLAAPLHALPVGVQEITVLMQVGAHLTPNAPSIKVGVRVRVSSATLSFFRLTYRARNADRSSLVFG